MSYYYIYWHLVYRYISLQYCEYHPNYDEAKKWMEENLTDDVKSMYLNEGIVWSLRLRFLNLVLSGAII